MLIQRMGPLFLFCVSQLFLGFGLHASVITGQSPVTVNLGTGANVSYLVFDESSLSIMPIIYAWHYDGVTNSSGDPWSGSDLMNAVVAESSTTPWALSYTTGAWGLFSSFTIGGGTSSLIDPLGSPVWTYWIQGGELDAYNYDTLEDFTISPLDWVIAPNTANYRRLSHGSYDAWTLSPFDYSGTSSDIINFTDTGGNNQAIPMGIYSGAQPLSGISPIPEPTTLPLLALSGISLFLFLRLRSASHS